MGDTASDASELQRGISEAAPTSDGGVVAGAMSAMFERDGRPMPPFAQDRSLIFG